MASCMGFVLHTVCTMKSSVCFRPSYKLYSLLTMWFPVDLHSRFLVFIRVPVPVSGKYEARYPPSLQADRARLCTLEVLNHQRSKKYFVHCYTPDPA